MNVKYNHKQLLKAVRIRDSLAQAALQDAECHLRLYTSKTPFFPTYALEQRAGFYSLSPVYTDI